MVQCLGFAFWIRHWISCNFWCKDTYKNDWNRGFSRAISSKCPFTQVWQLWLYNQLIFYWYGFGSAHPIYIRENQPLDASLDVIRCPNLPQSAWSTLVNQWFLAEIPRHWFMSFHGGNSCCTTVQGAIETMSGHFVARLRLVCFDHQGESGRRSYLFSSSPLKSHAKGEDRLPTIIFYVKLPGSIICGTQRS